MMARFCLPIMAMILLVACADASQFDVVVSEDSVTVWDASGRGMTVPMSDLTIHGIENIPIPTPTVVSGSLPTPFPVPQPLPTPDPGTVVELATLNPGNPFALQRYEDMRVSVEVVLEYMSLTELGGQIEDTGKWIYCSPPSDLSEDDLAILSTLAIGDTLKFVGKLESSDYDTFLSDCMPHQAD